MAIKRENYSALLNMRRQGLMRDEKWDVLMQDEGFVAYIDQRPEKTDASLMAITSAEELLARQAKAEIAARKAKNDTE